MPQSPHRSLALAAVLLALAGASLSTPAFARGDDDHLAAREALRRGEILPLSRILAVVGRTAPGDVIDVKLERKDDGRWEYEVKVLASTGRVRAVGATVTRAS